MEPEQEERLRTIKTLNDIGVVEMDIHAMSGRSKFRRYRPFILFVSTLFRIFPSFILNMLWKISDLMPNILGICIRYCIVKVLAKNCGDNVLIGPNVEIKGWKGLSIGSNVSIHKGCYIDASGSISIGNDVSIAHQSSILSFEHTWENQDLPIKYNPIVVSPVNIMDDVWIGCGCRILAGVTIGKRTVIAAGAVVVKNVEPLHVVGGVPAKTIKTLQGRKEHLFESPIRS